MFLAAGWKPGRKIEVFPPIPREHPAEDILSEFGGLRVGQAGSGLECATSDVAFCHLPPCEIVVGVWGRLLRTRLVGVAQVHNDHAELYLDESGRYFGASQMHDAFYFEGASFGEAMERLLLGRRSRPMLRPDQETITLYGETFTADDPAVYKYR